eukprot:3328253-Pleurochrysis_carterae.AAC.1
MYVRPRRWRCWLASARLGVQGVDRDLRHLARRDDGVRQRRAREIVDIYLKVSRRELRRAS